MKRWYEKIPWFSLNKFFSRQKFHENILMLFLNEKENQTERFFWSIWWKIFEKLNIFRLLCTFFSKPRQRLVFLRKIIRGKKMFSRSLWNKLRIWFNETRVSVQIKFYGWIRRILLWKICELGFFIGSK